ncbi:RING finger ubiquitin ligase [Seminavis robusta]|uniref:RING finger ubiquitin ligase n=1 Tax=Seminavis robusta TaxID=568900 RepID=A0A9N8EEC3_9STRA|nr:RING finger ubiquitin ligase [Seminavis robusta]|eukprot:Sro870_g213580.1 RING finger ubiquitin ligase (290) ;mRNA; f:405-1274
MIEISWGEAVVVMGVTFAVIGRKDLPRFAGYLGRGVGRTVGLLQGARQRAEAYAQETELKQLHQEFKSGLNELSAVRREVDTTMNPSRKMVGSRPPIQLTHETHGAASALSGIQTTTATAATTNNIMAQMGNLAARNPSTGTDALQSSIPQFSSLPPPNALPVSSSPEFQSSSSSPQPSNNSSIRQLPPESQTIGAVAEEEWEKQGMGFRSRAERGAGLGYTDDQANDPLNSGSSILANVYKQNLIHDQYDRVTQYQESLLTQQQEQAEDAPIVGRNSGDASVEKDKRV